MAVYIAVIVLGPTVGPIASGFMTQALSWRWIFYILSILDVIIQLAGFVWFKETYAPVILTKRAKARGQPRLKIAYFSLVWTNIERPFILLFTQPIVFVIAIYMTYIYGIYYLVLTTFPQIWSDLYGESIGIGGLNYIAIGIGSMIGTAIAGFFVDRIYIRLSHSRGGGVGCPEYRVPLMIPSSLVLPAGLIIYGWSAQYQKHWILPNLGILIFSLATMLNFQCMLIFVVDSYQLYAASALAATAFLRSIAGFGFPLFAESLYARLDHGWGNTLLALIAIVIDSDLACADCGTGISDSSSGVAFVFLSNSDGAIGVGG
ncbi:hypothetical protein HK405_006436 [Cladochytrium tenue]|nr:hypothetical protein HK405_006436 [Cladochytrium tenue]